MNTGIRSLVGEVRGFATRTHAPYSFRHIVQQAGWAGAAELAGLVLRYGLVFLIARLLGAAGLGLYALALVFGNGVAVVARSGMDQAILRYLPYYRARGEHSEALGVSLFTVGFTAMLGVLAAACLFLAAPHVETWWDEPKLGGALRLVALAVPAIALGEVCRAGLRGLQDVRVAVLLEKVGIPGITVVGLLLILLFQPGEPFAAVGGAVLAFWLAAILAGITLARELRRNSMTISYRTATWVRFALPASLWLGAQFIVTAMDQFMLGWYLDARDVGLYSAALRVGSLVALPLLAVNSIFAPTIASLHGQGDRTRLQQLYARLTWGLTLVALCIALVLWATGYWLLGIFGPAFMTAYPALAILVAGQMVNSATGPSGFILIMTNRVFWGLANAILTLLLNVGLNAWLIPRWGITGAATATAASVAVINVLQVIEVWRLVGISALDRRALHTYRNLILSRRSQEHEEP